MDYKLNMMTAEYNCLVEKKIADLLFILDGLDMALKHAEALGLDAEDMKNMIKLAKLDIDTHSVFGE
ncbi:hypothetical protein UFOVP180_45 [uncultured Caudovirales phage]|uniref:Uncharacterized protein n=1 Tax=uncultured Caudovirales phage TaxID=2100421 RepID=A0A6J7WDN7_9CAUD|nr:hypothetical protein UFOVP180_45 [uncultured Caudovirales phage]